MTDSTFRQKLGHLVLDLTLYAGKWHSTETEKTSFWIKESRNNGESEVVGAKKTSMKTEFFRFFS